MRILILSHMFPDNMRPVYGVFVYQQAQALQQLGSQCRVLSPVSIAPFPLKYFRDKWRKWAGVSKSAILDGIQVDYPRVFYLPGGALPHRIGSYWRPILKRKVTKLRRQFPFDIIHCHTAFPDGQAGVQLAKDFGVPVITIIHGGDFLNPSNLKARRRKALVRVLTMSDKVVTVSPSLAKIGADLLGDSSHFTTIANGVNLEDIYTGSSPKQVDYQGKIVLLAVGNLKKTKGFDYAIKATSSLLPSYPNLHLLIAGAGPEAANLQALVNKANVSSHVTFLGKLSHSQVMEYMSFADIFLLPSWQEGFGVVYVEAMAHGKPIIACKRQGIAHFITNWDNGILVEPQDQDDLNAALARLLANPHLGVAIGDRGRQLVHSHLKWEDSAAQLLALSRDLINNKK